jgi:hypothetical protein
MLSQVLHDKEKHIISHDHVLAECNEQIKALMQKIAEAEQDKQIMLLMQDNYQKNISFNSYISARYSKAKVLSSPCLL